MRPTGFDRWTWAFETYDSADAHQVQVGEGGGEGFDLGIFHLDCAPAVDVVPEVDSGDLFPELHGVAVSLQSALTAHNRAEAQLADANEQLRALVDAKDRFMASISHELRTPLASIIGFAGYLKDPDLELSEADRAAFVETISREGEDVMDLIEDLFVHQLLLDVVWNAKQHRPGLAGEQCLGRLIEDLAEIVGALDQLAIARDAAKQLGLIDRAALAGALLQPATAENIGRGLASQRQYRELFGVRIGNPGD